jgi:ABC-2 type transport system permease protein
MILKAFGAMVKARTMEFIRDRGTFFWNLLFPAVLVFGFAFAFSGNTEKILKIGVLSSENKLENQLPLGLAGLKPLEFIAYDSGTNPVEKVVDKLRQHQIDLLVDPARQRYWINEQSGKSQLAEKLLSTGTDAARYQKETVSGKAVRYVDWVVPGVIGMNVMFSCLFGVGYVLVRYRKNGVLKRLKATPVSALNFVMAQGLSRFMIVFATCIVVYMGTNVFLGFTMNGNYFDLALLTAMTILCMISLGLVFASRMKSEELVNGLMNLLTFPMILFSGVFFSLEGAPDFLKKAAQALPLTHFTDGSRRIMLEGAGLVDIAPDLAFLALFTVAFLALTAWLFKWE